MSQINPFTGSILQTPQVQRQQATGKDRQVRKVVEQQKNSGLSDENPDHQVESSEELSPIHEEQRQRRFKRPTHHHSDDKPDEGDDQSHLDLTA